MLKVVGASWSQIQISMWIIGIVIAIGIITVILTETGKAKEDGNYSATCFWSKEGGFVLDFWGQGHYLEEVSKGAARARYDPHINTTGWALFHVESQPEYPDWVQAYAAGMLEGSLTWQIIYWHWLNTVQSYCTEKPIMCGKIKKYLMENADWAKETASDNKDDPYWYQIYLFYMQLKGIAQGFEQGVIRSRQTINDKITEVDFLWMNSLSDLPDIEKMLNATELEEPAKGEIFRKKIEKHTGKDQFAENFDCGYEGLPLASGFVKFVPDHWDLYIAHNSAGPYSAMLKMFKKYQINYHQAKDDPLLVTGQILTFSSYPGAIHSMDEFLTITKALSNHKLVLAATALPIYDNTLWQSATAKNSILLGPRAIIASRLAKNPEHWSALFSKYNSGTGNKEWFIVDIGRFRRFISNDLLWVLEQIPGKIEYSDQTATLLNRTYWASYGIPFYESISILSGAKAMEKEHGNTFSYDQTALARIFARDQINATSMRSILQLMRSNMYKVDPLQEGNPRCAVGSRGDVKANTEIPEPIGVTDIKVMRNAPEAIPLVSIRNRTMRIILRQPLLQAVAGPAFSDNETPSDNDDLEPFSWCNSEFANVPHAGHPDVWKFPPLAIDF